MKAVVYRNKEKGAEILSDFSPGKPEANFAEINLSAAALNKRDDFILRGLYPGLKPDVVLGSDGSGLHKGKPVIFNPGINWGENPEFQSPDYQILGMPSHGTFGEKVHVPENNLFPKPNHLDFVQAAALPLAGVTAFRALFTRGGLRPGQKVLVSGGGGGVALFCIQFALSAGAKVFATTGSEQKTDHLKQMGVQGVVNYKSDRWDREFNEEFGKVDLVIDSAGGDGFHKLLGLLNPGGTLVTYGGTLGKCDDISPQIIFWKQLNIKGSTMGSDEDFHSMVDFVNKHKIVPVIDSVFRMDEFDHAIKRMRSGEHFGKIVLTIS